MGTMWRVETGSATLADQTIQPPKKPHLYLVGRPITVMRPKEIIEVEDGDNGSNDNGPDEPRAA